MADNRAAIIHVRPLRPVELRGASDGIVAVYREAFSQSPYLRGEADVRDFAESFARHATFAGFRAVMAQCLPAGEIVGFTYGYTLAPGQWWYEQVAPLLPSEHAHLLHGAFVLTQLAVRPERQAQGLGGRLHDALLTAIIHDRALLLTRQGDSPARHLYARRGWRTLVSGVEFPGAGHPYQVLMWERPRVTRCETSSGNN